MVKGHILLDKICPYTIELHHKVLVHQKYSSKAGMIVILHQYRYMNQMLKTDHVRLREIIMNQGALSHPGISTIDFAR